MNLLSSLGVKCEMQFSKGGIWRRFIPPQLNRENVECVNHKFM